MLPYLTAPKESFVKVGSPESGELYLKSVKSRRAGERKTLDPVDRIEAQASLFLLEFSQKVSEIEGITIEEAFEALVTGKTDVAVKYSAEYKKLSQLNARKARLSDLIPTVVIRERLLYPVKLAKPVKAGDARISLESVAYPIDVKSQIKFGNTYIDILSEAYPSGESVDLPCEPVKTAIKADAVGFICDRFGAVVTGHESFDSIPEHIIGVLSKPFETQADFLNAVKELSEADRNVFLESFSDVGFTDELIPDILLRYRTYNVRNLSDELISQIIAFYSSESSGKDATEKKA